MKTTHAIGFHLDGREIDARPGESILQAALRHGVEIPCLCYRPGYRADGNCRACVVEIEGERTLAPACRRQPSAGMHVDTTSARARRARALVVQLLAADRPEKAIDDKNDELNHWLDRLGLDADRFTGRRHQPSRDTSHPAIEVDLSLCIQCGRCVRACREEQVNDVIGYACRGARSRIVFDLDDPLGDSSCVACGECVQACPTAALKEARGASEEGAITASICPYCGVGCLVNYRVRDGRIVAVEGRDGPANHGRLCVKGRFGFDYVHHSQRLTRPLIRRDGIAKHHAPLTREDIPRVFREATWDEALDAAATGLRRIRDTRGSAALAGYGSAKGSNEEAYLFQKLVRTGFGTNNVDHCTRLCHASSVTALLEGIGSSAVTNQVANVENTEVIIVIGAKPTSNHPVAATFMKNAVKQGATLILLDPYRSDLARHAAHFLRFRPDTDVALLNAMMHCIIAEGLHDQRFIDTRTEGFEALRANLRDYSPERVAPICGVAAERIRAVARLYATARAAMIFWGMGITQHIHGTDNARCLIALALLTGQIGRDGAGLHPLRGQNNVQGASDMGLIPMVFPGYRPVSDADAQAYFRELWGSDLDARPGLTVVEIMQAAHRGEIRGMYIEGENPAMSDPNLNHTRAALAKLDHLVVQDIFFTETAGYADVILPASAFAEKTGSFTNTDRRVQIGRQAIQPPGDARQDLWIIQQIARRLGLDWHYTGPEQVFEELCRAVPDMAGMSWALLEREHSLTYPMRQPGDPGQATLFTERFPTASGRGRFVPARYTQADELPDDAYPLVFTTGRQLEHWHTGAMSRRARVLDALEPVAVVSIHPDDLRTAGGADDRPLRIRSRRGEIVALAHADDGIQRGVLFMAFCYAEAAANLLTNEALDPDAKIPEFKYCAVNIASATQTSDSGVRAISSEARREEAVGPLPTTTSNAASGERARARVPRFGWRRLYPPGEQRMNAEGKAPRLSNAGLGATVAVTAIDENGRPRSGYIAAERPLTLFLDKREIVTLMTLGVHPELLVLGWLRNQRLIPSLEHIARVQVDWETDSAAVTTRHGVSGLDERLAHRTVTTGCGQGTVFGHLMDELDQIRLAAPSVRQSTLHSLLENLSRYSQVYRKAGAVHGCALCTGSGIDLFIEDVGRHNAVDAIAGEMWLRETPGHDRLFYTTGRLTSEMVIKVAQMGIPVLLSRSGITEMGLRLGRQLGVTLIARAKGRHFLVYNGAETIRFDRVESSSHVLGEGL